MWFLGDWIVSSQQQIDRVRLLGPQTSGKFTADKAGDGRRTEFRVVAHRVELNVGLDELCEVH